MTSCREVSCCGSMAVMSKLRDLKSVDSGYIPMKDDNELTEPLEESRDQYQIQREDSLVSSYESNTQPGPSCVYVDPPTDALSRGTEESVRIPDLPASRETKILARHQDSTIENERLAKQATISKLENYLDEVLLEKERVKKESLIAIQLEEAKMAETNAEIKKLKDRLESLPEDMERNSQSYEAELQEAKERLAVAEKEHVEATFKLEIEVLGHMKGILKIQVKEESVRRQLAEANLSLSELETSQMKFERDRAMKEYESAKAALE